MNAVLAGGFKVIRAGFTTDSNVISEYEQLAAKGIKIQLVSDMHNVSAQTVVDTLAANPAFASAVWALEGPNEVDVNAMPDGGNWATETQTYMQTLASGLHGNPVTSGIKVIDASLAQLGNLSVAQQLGNLASTVDYGNSHAYPGGNPAVAPSDQLEQMISAQQAVTAPGKPVIVSETGYSTQQPAGSDTPPGNQPVPAAEQGILIPQAYMMNFANHVAVTEVYELVNEWNNNSWEGSLGLLNSDYSAKPAYSAVQAITTLLQDSGGTNFQPGQLSFSLNGGDADTHSLLLEKSDGTFWLSVWEATTSTNPVPVTLTLGNAGSGTVYVPYDSGTNAVSSFSNTNTVSFNASGKVTLIEITGAGGGGTPTATPATAPATTPTTTPTPTAPASGGTGTNSLTIHASEDAYQGDAQFTVTVDGVQIGGTETVTASHAAGQWQGITLQGNFGSGPHTVAINFVNDLWGGTASTDRNLYIQSVDMNGHAIQATTGTDTAASAMDANDAPLLWPGTVSLNVPAAAAAAQTPIEARSSVQPDASGTATGPSQPAGLYATGPGQTLIGNGGDDVFHIGGYADTKIVENGTGISTVKTWASTYTLTAGISNLVAESNDYAHHLTGNGGNNYIYGSNANDVLNGGGGSDVFVLGTGANTVTGGGGATAHEAFVFSAASDQNNTVTDFHAGSDMLDLRPLMQAIGYKGTDPVADHILQLADTASGDAQLLIDPTGAANGAHLLVTVQHVQSSSLKAGSDYVWH